MPTLFAFAGVPAPDANAQGCLGEAALSKPLVQGIQILLNQLRYLTIVHKNLAGQVVVDHIDSDSYASEILRLQEKPNLARIGILEEYSRLAHELTRDRLKLLLKGT